MGLRPKLSSSYLEPRRSAGGGMLYRTSGGGMSPSPGSLYVGGVPTKSPNPDPFKFHIVRVHNVNPSEFTALMVNYPDATTYEGNKVMVVKLAPKDILLLKELDPHFYPDGIVLARFEPTEEGWIDAIAYCERKNAQTD